MHPGYLNRLISAVRLEGFSLVEKGKATLEAVDKSFRYYAGSWIPLMGVFRRMDYTGLADYPEIFQNIFPQLCNEEQVLGMMQEMIDQKAKGTQNVKGLYLYTAEDAEKLEDALASFNEEMYQLASLYPSRENMLPEAGVNTSIDQ